MSGEKLGESWSALYSALGGHKSSAQQRVRDSFYRLVDFFAADWALSNAASEAH